MTRHTPSPWNVQLDSDLFAKIGSQGNGGIYVAKVQGPDTAANARLIAAAPDMLEMLELVVGTLSFDRDEPFNREVLRRINLILAQVSA